MDKGGVYDGDDDFPRTAIHIAGFDGDVPYRDMGQVLKRDAEVLSTLLRRCAPVERL